LGFLVSRLPVKLMSFQGLFEVGFRDLTFLGRGVHLMTINLVLERLCIPYASEPTIKNKLSINQKLLRS
jgi:hypothetical protein